MNDLYIHDQFGFHELQFALIFKSFYSFVPTTNTQNGITFMEFYDILNINLLEFFFLSGKFNTVQIPEWKRIIIIYQILWLKFVEIQSLKHFFFQEQRKHYLKNVFILFLSK